MEMLTVGNDGKIAAGFPAKSERNALIDRVGQLSDGGRRAISE
jgi:hypothetical protein